MKYKYTMLALKRGKYRVIGHLWLDENDAAVLRKAYKKVGWNYRLKKVS